jgi:TonB family protein
MAALPEPVPYSEPILRLLVELPSWPRVFFGNLRDLVAPRRLPRIEISSAPAPFWPDVFVKRRLPWHGFFQSVVWHFTAFALLVGFTRLFALHPHAVLAPSPAFDHSQVIYYASSEYLPPLDTRRPHADPPQHADPEFSPQPIISVPPEADNRSQTIVTPPHLRIKHDVALPNIVAWSDKQVAPQLAIPAAPVIPAAEINRIAPRMEPSVVTPPPDAAHLSRRHDQPSLPTSVVAPPPTLSAASESAALQAPQPSVIAPPPSVDAVALRDQSAGELNIGRSSVIAPAPELPVAEQRAVPGGRLSSISGIAAQVVAPPPSFAMSGSSGSPGRAIALNLHPAVGAPPDVPAGNRRGSFAATPEGHAGASGSPGSLSGGAGKDSGGKENGSTRKNDLPAGLYVGKIVAPVTVAPVAGDPSARNLASNADPDPPGLRPHATSTPAIHLQPGNAANLSAPERAVFGARRFYSLTLSMPNLNSGGGSWVIRFSEIKPDSEKHGAENIAADLPAGDLTPPTVTRKVDPAYPLNVMRENVSGTVILYAIIHADGTVSNVRVLRGVDERLDRFAVQAITQWKFDPATKNGAPIDVEATFQIPFRPTAVGTSF